MPKFPCRSCNKNVNENHKEIQCDICDIWIHIKCNFLNKNDYEYLQNSPNSPFYCIKCIEENLPFSKLLNKEFCISIINGVDNYNENMNIDFLLPSQNTTIDKLNTYIQQKFQLMTSETDDDDDTPPINCNYYSVEEFKQAKFNAEKSFSIFHMNISSLNKHFEELQVNLELMFKLQI